MMECSPRWSDYTTGLRVLVVDDDSLSLKVVGQLLKSCGFTATCCTSSTQALNVLRKDTAEFDLVLSDVFMPDVDGFKLLEIIGLELNLPVIMMSTSATTDVVFQGVTHGAVDFLIKPVRLEELRNIWQHVVRRKKDLVKDNESDEQKRNGQDGEDHNHEDQSHCTSKKRKAGTDTKGRSDEMIPKKPRVTWSAEMHEQFVNAVKKLGIDKAVPKKILEMMNVGGLTRENVASHLQKYRLYLKRMDGMPQRKGQQIKSIPANDSTLETASPDPSKQSSPPQCVSQAPSITPLSASMLALSPHMGGMLPSPAFPGINMASMLHPSGLNPLAGLGLGIGGLAPPNPCMLPILQHQQHLMQQMQQFWPEANSRNQSFIPHAHNQPDAFSFGALPGLSPYAPLAIAQGLSLPAEPSPQSSGEAEGSDQVPSANLLGEPCSTQGCEQTDAIMMSQMPTTNVGAEMQLQMPSLVANPATTMNEYQIPGLPQIASVNSMNSGTNGDAELGVPANLVHMEGLSGVTHTSELRGNAAVNFDTFQGLRASHTTVEDTKESMVEFLDEILRVRDHAEYPRITK